MFISEYWLIVVNTDITGNYTLRQWGLYCPLLSFRFVKRTCNIIGENGVCLSLVSNYWNQFGCPLGDLPRGQPNWFQTAIFWFSDFLLRIQQLTQTQKQSLIWSSSGLLPNPSKVILYSLLPSLKTMPITGSGLRQNRYFQAYLVGLRLLKSNPLRFDSAFVHALDRA